MDIDAGDVLDPVIDEDFFGLFPIWSNKVKLVVLEGKTETSIFYWFSMTAIVINPVMFSSAITVLTSYCEDMLVGGGRRGSGGRGGGLELSRNETRSGDNIGERGGLYGALGYRYGEEV